ncbi:MAG: DUF4954 family protein [Muribaculaceae bacterium]|nr:DUF4954 family protein [Muribaculaceae bacterium]
MIHTKNYRSLTDMEIATLTERGCTATDWSDVLVSTKSFDPEKVTNVEFSGKIKLGSLEGDFVREGGMVRHSMLSNVTLHNVTIGDGVMIRNVANYIANYEIGDHVYIDNINCLVGTLDSTFGIGTEVSVLNETGGREVPIYENMSAQTAYLIAMYRHDTAMVNNLTNLIKEHAASLKGQPGRVGDYAEVTNCGTITDVVIGEYARVKGATRLRDGYITGSESDPVTVGRDVIAEGFVLASGSRVDDGAVVHHCFVGQASVLSHLFSAHDSLFFANCNCENGEAAAIFGGPYTVTMHKSSLLIAGIFSFLNAGSGSNQSNHMYKLGPIHQGVVERGSKTTSDSYILWPAKIGAFSLVMGRHVNHPDTSRLPFSYLIENKNESFLVPGVNLRSVGTIRDAQKWPKRDKRKDDNHLDSINFNLLSPYTIGKMINGLTLLDDLERTAGVTAERFSFQAMTIEARALRRGREFYRLAIDKFMGNSVISQLGDTPIRSNEDLRQRLAPKHSAGRGRWVDVCGLFLPKSEIDHITRMIGHGEVTSLNQLELIWKQLHSDYYKMEWTWVIEQMNYWWSKEVDELTLEDITAIIDRWLDSVTRLDNMLLDYAGKEYSLKSRTGFGIDYPEVEADGAFVSVRGEFEADPFVAMVREHITDKSLLAKKSKELIGN